jgi:hypothetical protein
MDAYQVASPVTIFSGTRPWEKRFFSGFEVQPAATEKVPMPASLRKVRRFIIDSRGLGKRLNEVHKKNQDGKRLPASLL